MIFTETNLKDAYTLELEKKEDQRGFFARTYCQDEFKVMGISFTPVQANLSYNKYRHTLRGMHYQASPFEEAKLVSCIKGAIFDVIIDIRPGSPTYCEWIGVELSADNKRLLFVPEGFAHGFLTLERETEISYLMSEFYTPGTGRGIRWDDPVFHINWPGEIEVISEQDKKWPSFNQK